MNKTRLEAFSDGVLAIVITIMVLELKVPHGDTCADLLGLWPVFLSYVLSFMYVGIYWNNHHHMFHTVKEVTGGILWANLHLLFWLSLMPFSTAWMGENHFAQLPIALYVLNLLMCAIAYKILTETIIASQGANSELKKAYGKDRKGTISLIAYISALFAAWFGITWLAGALAFAVALLWLVPDRRIENYLKQANHAH